MDKLSKAKEIIKAHISEANCGLFDCRNCAGDYMTTIYNDGDLVVDICYEYRYFEVFGLSAEEFDELLKYYNEYREDEERSETTMNIEFKGKMYIINTVEDLNKVQNMLTTAFVDEKYGKQDLNSAIDKIFDGIENGDDALADLIVDKITDSERLVDGVVAYALSDTNYSEIDEMTDTINRMVGDYEDLSSTIRDLLYTVEKWC